MIRFCCLAVLGMGGLLIPQTGSAAFIADFSTGYVAGPLNGQNGWVNASGSGLTVDPSGGNPGGAAVSSNAASNGSYVLHGVPLTAGETYRFAADISIAEGANIYAGLGWTAAPYINVAAWNSQGASDGFRLETSAGSSQNLGIGLTDQWYHFVLDWAVGGDATMTVFDATNAQVYQTSVSVPGISAAAPSMGELVLYANGVGVGAGSKFDNVSFGPVPEPSGIVLASLGIGTGVFGVFRRRRQQVC